MLVVNMIGLTEQELSCIQMFLSKTSMWVQSMSLTILLLPMYFMSGPRVVYRLEIYNHSWFRTAYVYNNIHTQGVRIGYGFFGLVYPTVTYSDLLLNVGPMQKKYNDGVIRSTIVNTHDLGSNPNVKPYHYQGDPDQ